MLIFPHVFNITNFGTLQHSIEPAVVAERFSVCQIQVDTHWTGVQIPLETIDLRINTSFTSPGFIKTVEG